MNAKFMRTEMHCCILWLALMCLGLASVWGCDAELNASGDAAPTSSEPEGASPRERTPVLAPVEVDSAELGAVASAPSTVREALNAKLAALVAELGVEAPTERCPAVLDGQPIAVRIGNSDYELSLDPTQLPEAFLDLSRCNLEEVLKAAVERQLAAVFTLQLDSVNHDASLATCLTVRSNGLTYELGCNKGPEAFDQDDRYDVLVLGDGVCNDLDIEHRTGPMRGGKLRDAKTRSLSGHAFEHFLTRYTPPSEGGDALLEVKYEDLEWDNSWRQREAKRCEGQVPEHFRGGAPSHLPGDFNDLAYSIRVPSETRLFVPGSGLAMCGEKLPPAKDFCEQPAVASYTESEARADFPELYETLESEGFVPLQLRLRAPVPSREAYARTLRSLGSYAALREVSGRAARRLARDLPTVQLVRHRTNGVDVSVVVDDEASLTALLRHAAVDSVAVAPLLRPRLTDMNLLTAAAEARGINPLVHGGERSIIGVIDTGVKYDDEALADKRVRVGDEVLELCVGSNFTARFTDSETGQVSLRERRSGCPDAQLFLTGEDVARPPAGTAFEDHGTAMAHIAAGNVASASATFGVDSGMAPSARVIAIRSVTLLDDGSIGSYYWDIIEGMDYLVAQKLLHDLPIDVVNLSLGATAPHYEASGACSRNVSRRSADASTGLIEWPHPGPSFAYNEVYEEVAAYGIAAVGAAGNSGRLDQVEIPGCLPAVLSVSSLSNFSPSVVATNRRDYERFVETGRVNSSQPDSVRVKSALRVHHTANVSPALDLLAPGEGLSRGAGLSRDGQEMTGGSSNAVAMVSGAIAVLQSARRDKGLLPLSVNAMRQVLTTSGTPVVDHRQDRAVYPTLNLCTAMHAASIATTCGATMVRGALWEDKVFDHEVVKQERGLDASVLRLVSESGEVIHEASLSASAFAWDHIEAGRYIFEVEVPETHVLVDAFPLMFHPDRSSVAPIAETPWKGRSEVFDIKPGARLFFLNAGARPRYARVTGSLWQDADGDGNKTPDATGKNPFVGGVDVVLREVLEDGRRVEAGRVTSRAERISYVFEEAKTLGSYELCLEGMGENGKLSPKDAVDLGPELEDEADVLDSDFDPATGCTDVFRITEHREEGWFFDAGLQGCDEAGCEADGGGDDFEPFSTTVSLSGSHNGNCASGTFEIAAKRKRLSFAPGRYAMSHETGAYKFWRRSDVPCGYTTGTQVQVVGGERHYLGPSRGPWWCPGSTHPSAIAAGEASSPIEFVVPDTRAAEVPVDFWVQDSNCGDNTNASATFRIERTG